MTRPLGLLLATLMACSGATFAGAPAPASIGTCDCPDDGAYVGNPINVATGNKYQHEIDVKVSSLLGFERHFNSQQIQVSSLGLYWTHSYSSRVTTSTLPDGKQVADVLRPSGRQLRYVLDGGGWVPDANVPQRLTAFTDGAGNRIGWEFSDTRVGRRERFDAAGRLTASHDRSGDYVDLAYEANGPRLQYVQGRDGRRLIFRYDAADRIAQIIGPGGEEVVFTYDAANRLQDVGYAGGASRTYLYNEAAHTQQADLPNALTGLLVDGKRFATYGYNAAGAAISTEHSGANRYTVMREAGGAATVTTPDGATERREFTSNYQTPSAKSVSRTCDGCPTQSREYAYDASGYLREKTVGGVTTRQTTNSAGQVTQRVEAAGTASQRTIQTDWHLLFGLPTERRTLNAAGSMVQKENWTYNVRGQVLAFSTTAVATGTSRMVTNVYCEQSDVDSGACPFVGLLRSTNGARTDVSDVTQFSYHAYDAAACDASPTTCAYRRGDLWKVTNAAGHAIEYLRYDGAGRPLSVKDANGVVTDMEYHPRGWLKATKVRGIDASTEADDVVTSIDYWPTGLVRRVTQPDGSYTTYEYDAAHRLTAIADNIGDRIEYQLDNAGNRTREDTKDTQGNLVRTLSRVYNQLGQLQAAKDAYEYATTFAYDASGNTDTVTDAKGRLTDNDYDPLERLSRTLQDVAGIRAETRFAYDVQDNLTSVVDPKGLETKYVYNGLGDLIELRSPDTGVTLYTYDSAGNRRTQKDARGQLATYGYDVLNRLTGITYGTATTPTMTYAYDTVNSACAAGEAFAKGRLTRMTDASGTTQYCYDRFGRLVRKVQTTNGKVFTARYEFSVAGRLLAMVYPSGARVTYGYNARGQQSSVSVARPGQPAEVLLSDVQYYPFGPASRLAYGGGRVLNRTLNRNYQPGVVQDMSAGGLSLGFEFDEVGDLAALRDGFHTNPPLRQYEHDALGRLKAVKNGAGTLQQGYAYDATGNRISATAGSTTTAYTYATASHRLDKVGATARTYDAAGNTRTIGGTAREFLYDATGRMTQLKQGGKVAMNYAYNAKGEQVRRFPTASSTAQTYFVYDEAGHWIGEYNASGVKLQEFIWLGDLPVGVIATSAADSTKDQLYQIQPDHLGTPRVVIDAVRQKQVWRWDLTGEAFGTTSPVQDPDGDGKALVLNMRFPGQRYDSATGLNHNYFRDYDASTGRYAESDPIGLEGGISTYSYAHSQPLVRRDPLGLLTDRPGEYCEPGRGCGARAHNKNYWCGESCRNYCRAKFTSQINDMTDNYMEDSSCERLAYENSSRQNMCEQMQSVGYLMKIKWLNSKMRECVSSCKPCPCG